MSFETYYVLRHLKPKESGEGQIVHAFSTDSEPELSQMQEQNPDLFLQPGYYTLMKSTNQVLTIN